jgi:hypothetical protein
MHGGEGEKKEKVQRNDPPTQKQNVECNDVVFPPSHTRIHHLHNTHKNNGNYPNNMPYSHVPRITETTTVGMETTAYRENEMGAEEKSGIQMEMIPLSPPTPMAVCTRVLHIHLWGQHVVTFCVSLIVVCSVPFPHPSVCLGSAEGVVQIVASSSFVLAVQGPVFPDSYCRCWCCSCHIQICPLRLLAYPCLLVSREIYVEDRKY